MTKSLLQERAPMQISAAADILSAFITSSLPVEEMRKKRGADFGTTKFYQIRVKPIDRSVELSFVLDQIMQLLKSSKAKQFGITEIQQNDRSRNSSKYSSVSFNSGGFDFDIVVAFGANKGETFEKDLLLKMDNLVAGVDDSEEAKLAFKALEGVDPIFKMSNILGVSARSGTTQRSGDLSPEEAGKIIADVVIDLKKGGKKYISVKNKRGTTVAQFGISKAFSDSLKINQDSAEWKTWLKPFNLDLAKIEEGLVAARDGKDVKWSDVDTQTIPIKKTSPIYKIMEKMWGSDYYYLRQTSGGFKALKIDKEYIDSEILSGLKVTEIRYPSKARKQINVYLESDSMNFKLEARNPRGKGDVRPTQIQLTIMKMGR
jgi:hypothetical protein